MDTLSKFAGQKINVQKALVLLYTIGDPPCGKLNSIPFSIASKRTKYSEINFSKDMKDSYTEKYKQWMKEI